jgi:hypothetical protein
MAWIIGSFAFSAWPSYEIARVWLMLRRRLPWPLMDFLADAHQRGLLRQAGAVYRLRHMQDSVRFVALAAAVTLLPRPTGSSERRQVAICKREGWKAFR